MMKWKLRILFIDNFVGIKILFIEKEAFPKKNKTENLYPKLDQIFVEICLDKTKDKKNSNIE